MVRNAHRDDPAQSASDLADLGALLLDAGLPVTDVRTALVSAGASETGDAPDVAVLPSHVLVGRADGPPAWATSSAEALTTRQSARALLLLRGTDRRPSSSGDLAAAIRAIRETVPAHPLLGWTAGSALVAVGLAILFRCPWWAVATAAVGGALVGLLTRLMGRSDEASAIIPFVAAFASTLFVGSAAAVLAAGPVPLFAVCAPIAILVPGALITNALLELTAADIVTGSARLTYGLVVLGFMCAGILAGGVMTGLSVDPASAALIDQTAALTSPSTGWNALPALWTSWIGVPLLAVGVGLAFGAGVALTAVGVLVMSGAFALLSALTPVCGALVATGATAAVLFVAARLIERLGVGIPAAVTFQPAFLLLVPGSVGLVALSATDPGSLATALFTFAALCIGTKVGAVVADSRPRRLPTPTRRTTYEQPLRRRRRHHPHRRS
ncbi:threonine/serine exporter family protein [Microbacterium sp.]|uniref:threonine/serine exporter family protein n=1 Tax=Microbacterium sp. TaxID=51671 RepID=UPI003340A11F